MSRRPRGDELLLFTGGVHVEQALYWSCGASLVEDARDKFDAFVKDYASLPIKTVDDDKLAGPGEIPGSKQHMPRPDSLYQVALA